MQFFIVIAKAASQTTQSIRSANNYRITQIASCGNSIVYIGNCVAFDIFYVNFRKFLIEKLTIFSIDNGLYRRPKHFYVVFFKNSLLIQRHSTVECCLSAKGKKNSIRSFLFNDFFDKIRSNRQKINLIGNAFRSLNGSNIRIDENSLNVFFF